MIDFFVDGFSQLNNLVGNLGVTIILIAVVSRVIFYPLTKSSVKQAQKMREMKPQLDQLKKKYGSDRKKMAEVQAKLYKESGVNAAGCLAPLVQLIIAIILFQVLLRFLNSGVDTSFLIWNLAEPNTYEVSNLPFKLPGILVAMTAVATFIQSKMMQPAVSEPTTKIKKKSHDLSDALASSQGQLVYMFPVIILFTGTIFPAGLALFWTVSTFIAIVQQYQIAGLGGLEPWVKRVWKKA